MLVNEYRFTIKKKNNTKEAKEKETGTKEKRNLL
jgi:hypothetical protein